MSTQTNNEKPEVYALRQDGESWRISRRDFLKAAGAGAAVLGVGMESGCSRSKPLDEVCQAIPSQDSPIGSIACSEDLKYLLTFTDGGWTVRCWDFDKQVLLGKTAQYLHYDHTVGSIDGKPCVVINPNYGSQYKRGNLYYYELPISDSSEDHPINRNSYGFNKIAMDSVGNLYMSDLSANIHYFSRESDYQQDEIIYTNSSNVSIRDINVFNKDRSLFVKFAQKTDGAGILDLSDRKMTAAAGNCANYSILPDDSGILVFDDRNYSLISPDSGSEIWRREAPVVESVVSGPVNIVAGTAVPDNLSVILLLQHEYASHYHYFLYCVSMEDGSVRYQYSLDKLFDPNHDNQRTFAGPVVNHDGTRLALSIGASLLFFSLPDLHLTACPMDLDAAKDDTKGIEVSAKDPDTGQTYTYSMPCGAEIPSGAVCTCNCVKGRGGCACDSYVKSGGGRSNGNGSGGSSGGSHYWHPN